MRPYQAETPVVAGEAAIVAVPLAGERDARPYQAQAADLAQSRRGAEPAADALVAAGVAPQVAPQTGAVPAGASEMRPYQAAASAAASATAAAAAPAPSTVLVQAAQAVADTLLVSPGLLRGQGEIVVQLRPDVLEGTEVRIAVTGRQLDVQFCPTTVNMAVLLEGSRTQIASHLSAKIASFNVTVDVRKKRT